MRRALAIVWGLLRELSDEGAYQRYLTAQGLAPSRDAWRLFHEGRLRAKYQRAKCC